MTTRLEQSGTAVDRQLRLLKIALVALLEQAATAAGFESHTT